MMDTQHIKKAYEINRSRFADFGIDTDRAMDRLKTISLSLPCWQGDDVRGFEKTNQDLSGSGLQVTGSYPGRARTLDDLRIDLEKAFSLVPGRHRLNLHAMYGDFGDQPVDRNEIEPVHFKSWVDWAEQNRLAVDFNATLFSHPKAASGFTLSHRNKEIRKFWIEHVRRCRKVSAFFGRELKSPCIHNLWIPDGSKDEPFDRWVPRLLLRESLDEIFETKYSPAYMKDSLESKLFGLGSEAYVVGSHEFYLAYAVARRKIVCLDLGHFHPTESVADKISSILPFTDEILLHLSRPVRWDSDHVVILNDDLILTAEEIVRSRGRGRIHIALDFFDASINRVGALVIGSRAVLKALLRAFLRPEDALLDFEERGRAFERLAFNEEVKALPFGPVWDYYCLTLDVPPGIEWLADIERYEQNVLSKRENRNS